MTRIVAALARDAWPLGVAAAAFMVAVGLPAGDPDMWWHLASGRWMLDHRDVLRVDVFSSTATGSPYALGQRIGEVVLYLAFLSGSWLGLATLRAALVAVAAFALTRSSLRAAPPLVAVPLAAVALVLSKPIWTDRPQLFTLALFPLLLELLLAARAGSGAALVATVPLLLVWSELHGGYALGLALVWLFALAAPLERRAATGFLAAAMAATVLVGLDPGALSPLSAAGHVASATRGIVEESPVDVLTPFGALFALLLGVSLAVFLRAGADPLAALVLVPMLWLALSAQRHIPLFGLAVVPFVSGAIWSAWEERAAARSRGSRDLARASGAERAPPSISATQSQGFVRRPRDGASAQMRDPRGNVAAGRVGLAAALWIGALASIATAPRAPDTQPYPVGAQAALKASSGILLNEYDWGGWLIWNVPERPVFIDGRLFPFVPDVLDGYRRALHVLPGWRAVLDDRDVTQALLRPDRPLTQALSDEGWTVRARGEGYVLLERPR